MENQMKLDEYVEQIITQIVDGVIAADSYLKNRDARVNPRDILGTKQAYIQDDGSQRLVEQIDFDIAVTVTEGGGKEGGAGITVFSVATVGGKASSQFESSAVSRVKFSVPLMLPAHY